MMTTVIRHPEPSDHERIMAVMPDWWGGRDLRAMLPRLFLHHFNDTSFVAEEEGDLVAFLVGFMSPSRAGEAYIHFVGVHPGHRDLGLGRELYRRFFEVCRDRGRDVIRACTSPVNRGSILFHQHMGFDMEPGDHVVDGIPVTRDYNRPGDPKVLFTKHLDLH